MERNTSTVQVSKLGKAELGVEMENGLILRNSSYRALHMQTIPPLDRWLAEFTPRDLAKQTIISATHLEYKCPLNCYTLYLLELVSWGYRRA